MNGARLFLTVPSNRTRDNVQKLPYIGSCIQNEKNSLYIEDDRALEQVALRGSGVSSGDVQNLYGSFPLQSNVAQD